MYFIQSILPVMVFAKLMSDNAIHYGKVPGLLNASFLTLHFIRPKTAVKVLTRMKNIMAGVGI